MLERHPEFTFNQSTAQLFALLEEDDPALLERLVAHARDGRFETIGGMWVEPDCVMPTGESLARQLLYGQRYFRATVRGRTHRLLAAGLLRLHPRAAAAAGQRRASSASSR